MGRSVYFFFPFSLLPSGVPFFAQVRTIAFLLAGHGMALRYIHAICTALAQVGVTTIYDPAYVHLRYPAQRAVHEDMAAHSPPIRRCGRCAAPTLIGHYRW